MIVAAGSRAGRRRGPSGPLLTTVTAVQFNIATPGFITWRFSHPVTVAGLDAVFTVNGQTPTVMAQAGAQAFQATYAVMNAGLPWSMATVPTNVTSPGREIVAPASGTVQFIGEG
jgi:hypothetical protein